MMLCPRCAQTRHRCNCDQEAALAFFHMGVIITIVWALWKVWHA